MRFYCFASCGRGAKEDGTVMYWIPYMVPLVRNISLNGPPNYSGSPRLSPTTRWTTPSHGTRHGRRRPPSLSPSPSSITTPGHDTQPSKSTPHRQREDSSSWARARYTTWRAKRRTGGGPPWTPPPYLEELVESFLFNERKKTWLPSYPLYFATHLATRPYS